MSNNVAIRLSGKQVKYIIEKTGADSPEEAMEIFAVILHSERIDPGQMPLYVQKLMEKEGIK